MKFAIRAATLIVLIAAGIWLWRDFFPDDKARIRRRLRELMAAASFEPNEAPLIKLAKAVKVAGFFTGGAEIDLDVWNQGGAHFSGRDEIQQRAFAARNIFPSLLIDIDQLEFTHGPAAGRATVQLALRGRRGDSADWRTLELRLDWTNSDGRWLIQRASEFNYIQRP